MSTPRATSAPATRVISDRHRPAVAVPRRLPIPVDGMGLVQGRSRFLLPRLTGSNAIYGPRTIAQTGSPSPATAITAPGSRSDFLALGHQYADRHGLGRRDLADLRHARRLCAGPLGLPLHLLDPDGGAGIPRHAAHHAGFRLSAALLRAQHLGLSADHDHRAGGDQPALHAVDAALLLPVDPARTSTKARWSMAARASRRSAWWSFR